MEKYEWQNRKPGDGQKTDLDAEPRQPGRGAFGRDNPDSMRLGEELNRKISGQPSKQHSKYKSRTGKNSNG